MKRQRPMKTVAQRWRIATDMAAHRKKKEGAADMLDDWFKKKEDE